MRTVGILTAGIALLMAGCEDELPLSGVDGGADQAVEVDCSAGQVLCGAVCADLQRDEQSCGQCGRACEAGQMCTAGICAASCEVGLTSCGSDGGARF